MVEYPQAFAGTTGRHSCDEDDLPMSTIMRDQFNVETPLTCPICGGGLEKTMIRTLGTVTRNTAWELHAGHCTEHGWFQAEIVGQPPREIFAVHRPFGASRRIVLGDSEIYQFPTVWSRVDFSTHMNKEKPVDPLDAELWKPIAHE